MPHIEEGTQGATSNWQQIFDHLIQSGVPVDVATDFANVLAQRDWTGVTQQEQQRVLSFWARSGLSTDRGRRDLALAQQGIDPMTGRALPLGIEEQRQEDLRQSIQRRFGTTDPERLAEISEQQALVSSEQIRQRRFGEREARIGREAREAVGEQQTFAQLAGPTIAGLREEVSPAGQRFFERDLQRQFATGGFAQQQGDFRERLLGLEVRSRRQFGEEREGTEAQLERLRQRGDPFERFLKEFRPKARQQFAGLTAGERGFQSRQFRPRTRFL